MKLLVAGLVGVMVSAAMSVGCGPGLSHRVKAPEPTPDVFNAMDAELAHSMIGTTTVTSGDSRPMPEARLSVAAAHSNEPVVAAAPTWGAAGEGAVDSEGAGVAPAAAATAAPAAANDFDMHPYDKPAAAAFDMHPYD